MASAGPLGETEPVIRIVVVDDHYAVRLGLEAALDTQPDMVPGGAVGCVGDVAPLLYGTAPDVLIVDYRLPDEDGLSLCLRLRAGAGTPALLLHSGFADEWLSIATLIAGANGIVPKGANGFELAEAIRSGAREAPRCQHRFRPAGRGRRRHGARGSSDLRVPRERRPTRQDRSRVGYHARRFARPPGSHADRLAGARDRLSRSEMGAGPHSPGTAFTGPWMASPSERNHHVSASSRHAARALGQAELAHERRRDAGRARGAHRRRADSRAVSTRPSRPQPSILLVALVPLLVIIAVVAALMVM